MQINIRDAVIDNLKTLSPTALNQTIIQASNTNDEITLPGLGVILTILWQQLDNNQQLEFASLIKEAL